MLSSGPDRDVRTEGLRWPLEKSPAVLLTASKVAVLLLILAGTADVCVQAEEQRRRCALEFTSDIRTPVGLSRLEGVMTTDGLRHRLAIYWSEPRLVRDSTYFVNGCDLLFTEGLVHYWVPGMAKPDAFPWADGPGDPLLPRQVDVPSVVRSALAIVRCLRRQPAPESVTLNLRQFLQGSRTAAEYTCEYTPDEADGIDLFSDTVTDGQVLNALPLGREYKKEMLSDGSLKWRLTKALNNRFMAGVTVRRMAHVDDAVASGSFDVETLGQWTLIPESYRVYWSLRAAYSELSTLTDPQTRGGDACDRIESYLEAHQMPDHVRRAIEHLWVETAFVTGDLPRIRQALQVMVTGLCQDDAVSHYHAFLELAEVADTMEAEYPQQFRAMLEPLVEQMVESVGEDVVESLDRLIRSIGANKRFRFGDLLFETMRRQPLAEAATVHTLAAKYEAKRSSAAIKSFDLTKSSATVKRYLVQFDDGPAQGALSMDDLRHILETGLKLPDPNGEPDKKAKVVEDVLRSLRLIVGQGPFQGDRATLIASVERFSWVYYSVCRNTKPIHPALATFLALSFYDASTPQDHEELCGQIRGIATQLEGRLNTSIAEWKLSSLVGPEDVKSIVRQYCEEEFRRYVDDPLCPTFKFPLTANEKERLVNEVKPNFDKLRPLLEEMSLKVKYGGVSPQLKKATVAPISRAVQSLLPTMAFLRRPSYPGSVYQYRGRHGFAGVIPETVYQEDGQPKEEFKMMRYFHLGHRLKNVGDQDGVR